MSKIKQARAWLTRKEQRTSDSSSEKRGDITLQKMLVTAVAIILVGLVAAILVVVISNAGDDVEQSASDTIGGEIAVYDPGCRGTRIAVIARTATADGTDININVPWEQNGGYRPPAAATVFDGTATAGATEANIQLSGDGEVGFFTAAARITETRYNADFNGDGDATDDTEVVGVVRQTGVRDVAAGFALPTTAGLTTDVASLALPSADLTALAGGRLVLSRSDSCWGIST